MRAGPQSIPYRPFSKHHPVVRILSQSSFRGFEQEKKKKMVQIQFPEPEKPMEERGTDVERAGQGRAPLQIHKYTNTQIQIHRFGEGHRSPGGSSIASNKCPSCPPEEDDKQKVNIPH